MRYLDALVSFACAALLYGEGGINAVLLALGWVLYACASVSFSGNKQ